MEARKNIHPLVAVAAVSVTLFSLVGVGAITGLIPTSRGQSDQTQAAQVQGATAEPKPAMQPAQPLAATPEPARVEQKATVKHVQRTERAPKPVAAPVAAAKESAPVQVAQNEPMPSMTPPPPPPARAEPPRPVCYDCGVVESVREVQKKGDATGLGAAAGGVLGGVLGRQTGGGHGRDVMTVLGAVGGALAGNEIEKNVKKAMSYQIVIRFEDSTSRVISQDSPPSWRPGDHVRLVNGIIAAN